MNSRLTWLLKILWERYNIPLDLAEDDGFYYVSLSDHLAKIKVNKHGSFPQGASNVAYSTWDAENEGWSSVLSSPLPVLGCSDLPSILIIQNQDGHVINYDVLGLTYWMLTRQEEIGRTDLDNHGRFPATVSHAYKHDYLERPIVDEWLHILGQVIQRTWPNIQLKQHQFSIQVSHDVDNPSRYAFNKIRTLGKSIIVDLIKYRSPKQAVLAPYIWLTTKQKLNPKDPYNTFDWLMDNSDKNNLKSSFYFICGGNAPQDADYKLEHPIIRSLMRHIYERGHEIGLHPSYNTYNNPQAIMQEAQHLKKICSEEGIDQNQWGGRMHFLRWEQPTTMHGLEQAGINYDNTLVYADRPGFRCGTCFEYPAFDPIKQKALNLRIRPLIAMESSIIAKRYMGLGYTEQSLKTFLKLKETCKKFNGQFTLLWHNSHLTSKDKAFYERLIISSQT